MALLEARVKSVLSGDTLILTHVSNPTQERTLSLAYVSAPRLRREGDEVCLELISSFFIFFFHIVYHSIVWIYRPQHQVVKEERKES